MQLLPFKKIGLPLLLSLMPMMAAARGHVDTIKTGHDIDVYVRNDEAMKMKLIVQAQILDIESSLADYVRLGSGINADYLLPKYLSFNAGYKGTWYSMVKREAKDESLTQNDLHGFSVLEAGLRVHILDGRGWAKQKVNGLTFQKVKKNGSKSGKPKALMADFPTRRIVAVRAGFYHSNAIVSAHMNAGHSDAKTLGSVKTDDGSVFSGQYYTNSSTNGVYVGLTRIVNMAFSTTSSMDALNQKSRVVSIFKEMYADVIFANTTFDPFKIGGKEYGITPNAAGSLNTTQIGWRVGGRMIKTHNLLNAAVNYELGGRPGIAKRGAYVSLGLTMALIK